MAHGTTDQVIFDTAAQTVLRVLIASYFLAVSLELISGTDLSVLFVGVLPEPYDGATAAGLVFLLAFAIMLGMATRVAALMLALMTFYASYLTMLNLGVADELGRFWRDLALIAALLLTYGDRGTSPRRRRRLLRRKIVPRRVSAILSRAQANGVAPEQRREGTGIAAKHSAAILNRLAVADTTDTADPVRPIENPVPVFTSQRISEPKVSRCDRPEPGIENIFAA